MHGIGVSAVTAYTAHREWATRPPDERCPSVRALHEAARARRYRTMERDIEPGEFRTQAVASDALALCETPDRQAALTHWSFEQLAAIAGAPPKYLRSLPAPIASDAINYGLQRHASISTTLNIYTHVVDASHRKAVEDVEDRLFGAVARNGPELADGLENATPASRSAK